MECFYLQIILLLFITNAVRTDDELSKSTESKITSDKERNTGWACLIDVKGNYCSGVVLTTYFVVSSKRCYNTNYYGYQSSIYLGGHRYKYISDLYSPSVQIHRIRLLITSDDLGEVMLVDSETQFKFSQSVNSVSIKGGTTFENSKHFSCLFAGFGKRLQYDIPGQLSTQEFQGFTRDNCEPHVSRLFSRTESMICTKPEVGDNFGLCPGDYGGGLVCNNILVGIAHSTVYVLQNETSCGHMVYSNLFTYVGPLANSIDQQVQKHTRAIHQIPLIGHRLVSRNGADKWLPEMIVSLATYFICLFTIS